MWYALFDLEFEKFEFLWNPLYYTIGMNDANFNMKEFWIWVLYSCAQSAMILGLCLSLIHI